MILTENGVLKLMQRIKSFITSQLNTKANSVHTHTISEIDDLSSLQMGGGYTKSEVDTLLTGKADMGHTHITSDIITDLGTLFIISNIGYMTNLNDSTLRVAGKAVVCFYNNNTLNNPTPQASGICFTLANHDSSYYGIQITLSNKGIYVRVINDSQYSAWSTIFNH